MSAPPIQGLGIVLAGLPAAGKSSLLGALAQAAETQPALLGGKLSEASNQLLDGLQEQTYNGKSIAQAADVTAYPVTFESGGGSVAATLVDSGAPVAGKLITDQAALDESGPLPGAMQNADAVLLIVDAAARPADLDKDFQQLGQFLRRFEESRVGRADVGGLPVYLVLAKCDLLARKGDTASQWMQRIEEGKRAVDKRFHDVLAGEADRDSLPFGKIDLHLWATAVKRPALADRPARPDEPFGVAELFRQCLGSAQGFHNRRRRLQERLWTAVFGMLGLALVLGVLGMVLFLTGPSVERVALENAVRSVLPGPGASAAERLKEPLADKLKEIARIRANPDFRSLPEKDQQAVRNLQEEIQEYLKLKAEFARVQEPRFATRDDDLARIERSLNELALPDKYAGDWSETRLARRQAQFRRDVAALRGAVKDEEAWIRSQIAAAEPLTKAGGLVIAKSVGPAEREAWFGKVQAYLDGDVRHKRSDRVPGGAAVTYETVYRFQPVEEARKNWDKAKSKLRELRNLAQ